MFLFNVLKQKFDLTCTSSRPDVDFNFAYQIIVLNILWRRFFRKIDEILAFLSSKTPEFHRVLAFFSLKRHNFINCTEKFDA